MISSRENNICGELGYKPVLPKLPMYTFQFKVNPMANAQQEVMTLHQVNNCSILFFHNFPTTNPLCAGLIAGGNPLRTVCS